MWKQIKEDLKQLIANNQNLNKDYAYHIFNFKVYLGIENDNTNYLCGALDVEHKYLKISVEESLQTIQQATVAQLESFCKNYIFNKDILTFINNKTTMVIPIKKINKIFIKYNSSNNINTN